MLGTADSRGAEWEFRFWSHDGALTLLSWRRLEEGEGPAIPVGRGAFLPHFALTLPSLLGAHPREVTLTLERAETHWSVDLDTSSRDTTPAHTRMIPSARKGISEQTHRQALETARRVARLLTVPQGGSARLVARVSLEDERIVGLEPAELESSGDGPVLHASEQAVSMVVGTLLPFTRGLGERTVVLSLEGEHRPGEARPRWRVVEARTAEPPPLPKQVADIHQEYRALHESILVEFQEQSREYAILAAGISLEQFAYAIVGGLLIRRALALIELAAPTITSVLAQGGKGAVRWFRNLLVRTSPEDRALLQQLWMKAESQGLKSLTEVEKQQLRGLMGRLESLLSTPLDRRTKQRLWEWSRTEYFELHNPQLARLLGTEGMRSYQVHHICPMEYAHLFPKLDINGRANLAGLHGNVHESINIVWSSLREHSSRLRPQDVKRVVDIVNRHYGRWFDKLYDVRDASTLATAERAALSEVAQLKVLLSR
ncbi:MAG: hypothetical protein JXB05_22525 [Myxococcaceae bacterium]|nr:hypothetical protein [Myxococcaceae bacterium]